MKCKTKKNNIIYLGLGAFNKLATHPPTPKRPQTEDGIRPRNYQSSSPKKKQLNRFNAVHKPNVTNLFIKNTHDKGTSFEFPEEEENYHLRRPKTVKLKNSLFKTENINSSIVPESSKSSGSVIVQKKVVPKVVNRLLEKYFNYRAEFYLLRKLLQKAVESVKTKLPDRSFSHRN